MGCAAISPSYQKGGTRKHATPTPLNPFGLLVADLSPLITSLAPKCPQISDTIGLQKSFLFNGCIITTCLWLIGCSKCPTPEQHSFEDGLSISLPKLPLPSETLCGSWVCASLVLQLFCQGLLVHSCLIWPFSGRSSKINDLCQEQGHASGVMVHCWSGGSRKPPRASVCCACITGTATCTNCQAS